MLVLFVDDVNNTVRFGFFGIHKVVAVSIFFNLLEFLPGCLSEHFIETVASHDELVQGLIVFGTEKEEDLFEPGSDDEDFVVLS